MSQAMAIKVAQLEHRLNAALEEIQGLKIRLDNMSGDVPSGVIKRGPGRPPKDAAA